MVKKIKLKCELYYILNIYFTLLFQFNILNTKENYKDQKRNMSNHKTGQSILTDTL